jgi:hypothetical protein
MVSRNSKIPIPIPSAGVRKDFDLLSMPGEALEVGLNVIVRKGILCPRACHQGLDWYSSSEWGSLYSTGDAVTIAYESGNTRFLVGFADGRILVTDDSFATTDIQGGLYSYLGAGDELVKITHDPVNNLWIALISNGDIFTAPEAWPGGGAAWEQRFDGYDGTGTDLLTDAASGYSIAIIGQASIRSPSVYYSSDGTTWAVSDLDKGLSYDAELGFGGETGPSPVVYCRVPGVIYSNMLYSNAPNKVATAWNEVEDEGEFRRRFAGGGTTTCAVFDDGSTNKIQKSTDHGQTWADSKTSSPYSGDKFKRLFYDSTLGWLSLGSENYRSADATTWTEYSVAPFSPDDINDVISDGTDWFIVSASGVWLFPTTTLANEEKVVSMFQLDTEGSDNQIIVSTTKHLRKLNPTTGEFTDLTFEPANGDPAVEFDISADPRPQRTVFRAFPWLGPSGVENYYKYLLATNPDLPLVHWRDGENVQWCDYGNAPAAKVLLISANRVVAANGPLGSPHGVDCSDDLNPDSGWGGLNAGLLADTPGDITAGAELTALQFAIFKEDSVYHGMAQVEFGGVANAFRYELIRTGIQGPVSPHSLCRTPSGDFIYLGQDGGVYTYDGNSPQDLGVHVRRIIETQMDYDQRDDSWGYVDATERLAYFFFPTSAGNMNRGICIDLQSGAAWEIQLPSWFQAAAGGPMFITKDVSWNDLDVAWKEMTRAWTSFKSSAYYVVLGSENNTWSRERWDDVPSYTDFGEPISVAWKPGWSAIGNADIYSTLQEIRHRMALIGPAADGLNEFSCRGFSLDSEFDEDYEDDVDSFTSENTEYTTELDISGMLFRYEMNAEIDRRFVWGGGIARFRERGDW